MKETMLMKKSVKRLYSLYVVKGDYEKIKEDHRVVCYSNREATCIEYYYHAELSEWIHDLYMDEYKHGFGIHLFSEDEAKDVQPPNMKWMDMYVAHNNDDFETKIIKMANIIKYFLSEEVFYYEVERDNIHIGTELTGHMSYRSPYETCNSCGNCDGANCDNCMKRYIVKDIVSQHVYYTGYDRNEAINIRNENAKDYSHIIADICNNYNVNKEWFESEIGKKSDMKSLFKLMDYLEIPSMEIN